MSGCHTAAVKILHSLHPFLSFGYQYVIGSSTVANTTETLSGYVQEHMRETNLIIIQ